MNFHNFLTLLNPPSPGRGGQTQVSTQTWLGGLGVGAQKIWEAEVQTPPPNRGAKRGCAQCWLHDRCLYWAWHLVFSDVDHRTVTCLGRDFDAYPTCPMSLHAYIIFPVSLVSIFVLCNQIDTSSRSLSWNQTMLQWIAHKLHADVVEKRIIQFVGLIAHLHSSATHSVAFHNRYFILHSIHQQHVSPHSCWEVYSAAHHRSIQ